MAIKIGSLAVDEEDRRHVLDVGQVGGVDLHIGLVVVAYPKTVRG